MVKCPFCQTSHVDNTLFCNECGTYLQEEDTRDTFELEEDVNNKSASVSKSIRGNSAIAIENGLNLTDIEAPQVPVINLRIGSQERAIEITLDRIIYLGRVDPVANVYPEVDLTNDNGQEYGVSRQHVRLLPREAGVFIEDQGTINGSFINGKKLTPYLAEPLNNGDILKLGRLIIEVGLQ